VVDGIYISIGDVNEDLLRLCTGWAKLSDTTLHFCL